MDDATMSLESSKGVKCFATHSAVYRLVAAKFNRWGRDPLVLSGLCPVLPHSRKAGWGYLHGEGCRAHSPQIQPNELVVHVARIEQVQQPSRSRLQRLPHVVAVPAHLAHLPQVFLKL
eukprot:3461993-Pyramimonas_sp.AAC.2